VSNIQKKGNEQIRIECAVDRFGTFVSFPEETPERLKCPRVPKRHHSSPRTPYSMLRKVYLSASDEYTPSGSQLNGADRELPCGQPDDSQPKHRSYPEGQD
jgi:hypothetical protein